MVKAISFKSGLASGSMKIILQTFAHWQHRHGNDVELALSLLCVCAEACFAQSNIPLIMSSDTQTSAQLKACIRAVGLGYCILYA